MNESHSYRATILPVRDGIQRPLWSVMIPTYNCANYLRETLASVLAQDPGKDLMQIEVVDDHSTKDDPAAVVEELGRGRVGFYQQPENVGYIKNFETCLQRSRGQLIHLLHGDDCIRDGFYRKLQRGFDERPEIGAAFCRHIFMDEHGHWHAVSALEQSESGILNNWLERMAVRQIIQTPSIVVRREVYEKLGGFDSRIRCNGEDWEMWVRIATQYPVWYEVEPLAFYRMHSASLSGHSMRTGENIRDLRKVISIIKQYLPPDKASYISSKALEFYAFEALNYARTFAVKGDTSAAMIQIQEALQCYFSPKVINASLKLLTRGFLRLIKLRLNTKLGKTSIS
ncbi:MULTISPECIES: glycosyltransferase family 2 protein [Nostocales]|uniref:Family 2 glycosyl transferase n=3 Tax=Nostocales TaxID=1161 RepID=A0A0C1R4Z6_9CYAN|nr:glycosyltransferase [Tolypothrix bouteillei]KAF3886896.1 glycosyltransferase [Tolypothrix bouteillei VB521301]